MGVGVVVGVAYDEVRTSSLSGGGGGGTVKLGLPLELVAEEILAVAAEEIFLELDTPPVVTDLEVGGALLAVDTDVISLAVFDEEEDVLLLAEVDV